MSKLSNYSTAAAWVRDRIHRGLVVCVWLMFQIHPSNALYTFTCYTFLWLIHTWSYRHVILFFVRLIIVRLVHVKLRESFEVCYHPSIWPFTSFTVINVTFKSLSSFFLWIIKLMSERCLEHMQSSWRSTKCCVIRYLSAPLMRKVNKFWIFNEILSLLTGWVYFS